MNTIDKIRAEIDRRLKRENEILWNAKLRGTAYPPSVDDNLLTLTSLRDFLDTLEEPVSDQEPSLEQLSYDNLMALYKSVQFEIRRRADELTIHIEEKPYQK